MLKGILRCENSYRRPLLDLVTILKAVFAPVSIFKNRYRSAQMRAADGIFFQMRFENFLSLSTADLITKR